jgi:uncharacterized protein (TIGR03083 family)
MEHQEYVAVIRRDGEAVVRAARASGLDAEIPSCPGWTVADLVVHVARIHRWVHELVVDRPDDPMEYWSRLPTPARDELIDSFEQGCAAMCDALAAVDPGTPVFSWTADQTAGFWSRRQAHELAVHRWDAQTALDVAEPIDRELAVDGIQEVFDILPARGAAAKIAGNGETIHLHCTDAEGEWLLRLAPDGLVVTREHAKGDVAARGTASDLLLFMWGRAAPAQLEVFGDASLLSRWQKLAKF